MGIVAILLALLSATSHLWSAPPSPTFTVAGTVVDDKGKPVAGARVEMVRLGSESEKDAAHTAETDGEGRFRIQGLPLARFELTVGSPEHAPFVKRGIAAPSGLWILDLGKLQLRKRTPISGQVVDRQGRPVQDVEVWLRSRDSLREAKAAASTGPDGRFELRQHVLRDDEDLYICRPGYASQWVLDDDVSSQPLRIVLAPAVPVSGRVVDAGGNPVEGATFMTTFAGTNVSVGGPATSPCPSGELKGTGADGAFTLELEKPGWYQLRTSAPGRLSTTLERLHVPTEGLAALEIQWTQRAVVSGRVTNPKGAPIAGAEIQLSSGQKSGTTVSDAEGRYIVKGVEPGAGELSVSHPDYAKERKTVQLSAEGKRLDIVLHPQPWLEVRGHVVGPDGAPVAGALVEDLAGQTVTSADGSFVLKVDRSTEDLLQARKEGFGLGSVVLPPDQPLPDSLEIHLTRGVTLTGRLLGVEPEDISWAAVSLYSASYPGKLDALIDSDGAFRAFDLPPGLWKLSALAGGRFAQAEVEIPPDSSGVTQDIRFASTYEVRGRVTDPEGEPVPGANVDFFSRAGAATTNTVADVDGVFSVRLEDGVYDPTAIADGFERADAGRPLVVNGGPVDGVEIRLRPGVALTGRFPGLEPGEVPLLNIDGPGRRSNFAIPGEADQEGGYRLTNLGPGPWMVTAVLQTPGGNLERIAVGSVTIPEGVAEARLDLDFQLGDLTLTVRFTEPGRFVNFELRLPDGSPLVKGQDQSGDGRVHIPRLRAGSYRLRILSDAATVLLDQPVELSSDQEVVLSLPSVD